MKHLTIEFFNEAFGDKEIPQEIKNVSMSICKDFNIGGICDQMYIANVIAYELGIGDGCGNFNSNSPDFSRLDYLAQRLSGAYKTCISDSNYDTLHLETLLNELNTQ